MRINNNIQALNAYRNLYQNQNETSKNLEKLSSGLRINRAADDAAGLAISEKMRSQIRGLKMAERNAMDGISLMQTSEGAMQEVHSMLQRMRELAVQGANDTNTPEDREQIQKEIDQLKLEVNSISEKTEFNTRKLLDGSSAVFTAINDPATNKTNMLSDPIALSADFRSGDYTLQIGALNRVDSEVVTINQPNAGITNSDQVSFSDDSSEYYPQPLGEYTINVKNVNYDESEVAKNAIIEVIGPDGRYIEDKAVAVGQDETASIGGLDINVEKISRSGTARVQLERKADFTLFRGEGTGGDEAVFGQKLTTNKGVIRYGDMEYKFKNDLGVTDADDYFTDSIQDVTDTTFSLTNNSLAFQIGPNTDQQVMIDIPQMNIVELGIENVDVTTGEGANEAIFTLDQAINKISDTRSKLGAMQNRMEHTINNLQVTHENLTSAESRIRDADMALEMTEFTRNNILNQSATAMLAQANQLPQGVLQLLQ